MIDGKEAVRQAIYLILNTERYAWLIHSWNYGVELHSLIGQDPDFCIPEIERCVREALLQDDRITAVDDFSLKSTRSPSPLHLPFTPSMVTSNPKRR